LVAQVGVYSVLPPTMCRMPARNFDATMLRGCEMVEEGKGLQLVPPPTPKGDHELAVVMISLGAQDRQVCNNKIRYDRIR